MSTFPAVTGAKLIKALKKTGFEVVRVRGSHHFIQHMPMDVVRLFLSIAENQLAEDCLRRYYVIATCRAKTCSV